MASSMQKLTRQYSFFHFPTIGRVSWQRFRHSWLLLSVTWLGMFAMVILMCLEPLFGNVTTLAQLQDAARAAKGGAALTMEAVSYHPTATQIQQISTHMDQIMRKEIGNYVGASNQFVLKTPELEIASPAQDQSSAYHLAGHVGALSGGPPDTLQGKRVLSISAYDRAQVSGQVKLLQGRLPSATSQQLEIAISEKSASDLGLHLGSVVQARYPVSAGSVLWQMTVVGIITLQPSANDFWNTGLTNPEETNLPDGQALDDGAIGYNALAARQTVLTQAANISGGNDFPGFDLVWRYPLNLMNLEAGDLSTFLAHIQRLNNQMYTPTSIAGLNYMLLAPSNFVDTLYSMQTGLQFGQIVALFLLFLTFILALIMTGTMAQVVVEHETATIAAMRSRGATRGHIFWAFTTQGVILVLAAACLGPVLAWLLVRFMTARLLTSIDQAALNPLTSNLTRAMSDVRWYVFVVVLAILITLLIAVGRATKIDIVQLRRETARTTRKPFWRRFHLDILLALLICLGYVLYLYILNSPLGQHRTVFYFTQALSLVLVPFILSAVLLLFLRILPWLLRIATRIMARRGSAPTLLAVAQMERAPRTASRVILLCTVAFVVSLYLLSMIATQQQWYQTQTSNQVGADFSGSIDEAHLQQSFAQQMHFYSTIPGVRSTTLGYTETDTNLAGVTLPSLAFDAVDASTYANTASWSPDDSQQPLPALMRQLVAHRTDSSAHDVVYALVAPSLWTDLALYPGASFALPVSGYGNNQTMHFIALARVAHIPGASNSYSGSIDMLMDYQSYATVFAKDHPGRSASPNAVWLRTADDAASLASVRRAVPTLLDRRALLATAQVDPAHVNMLSIFAAGVVVALVLALFGTLVVSWLSINSRRTNFATLRALGMAPRQIVATIIWEQGLACFLALLLGLGLSALCAANVAPTLSYIIALTYRAPGVVFDMQNPLPIHIAFPWTQAALLLGILVASYGLALFLMAQRASRPALGQTLRLNED